MAFSGKPDDRPQPDLIHRRRSHMAAGIVGDAGTSPNPAGPDPEQWDSTTCTRSF